MIDDGIFDVEIDQISDSFFFSSVRSVLTQLNFSLGVLCPVFSLFFPIKMIAHGWVVLDPDNGAPTFAVFSFINGCHLKPLLFWFKRLVGAGKIVFSCTDFAPLDTILI